MESMEDKLGAILGNPQMMQQIMSMAQTLSVTQEEPKLQTQAPTPTSMPDFDPVMLQKVMGMAGHMGVDSNQKALLGALAPYLSNGRVQKLEKAMRAAKLASLASSAFSSGALSFLTGR